MLVKMKTDLKSLRYGKDQLGGGYSGQPYIQVPIPVGFNNLQLSNDDFILRGGALVARDSTIDILRLGKMFTDAKSPNGALFVAKQNLLSRTAVRTQTSGILNEGFYTPLSTLAQAGVLASGYHLNKQGLNPFAGTGAYSNNSNLYSVKVPNNQPTEENRLVNLYQAQQINQSSKSFGRGVTLNKGSINVLSYTGGPGSILGIGNTNIRYADNQQTGNANAKNSNGWYYGPFTWTAPIKSRFGKIPLSSNPFTALAGFTQAINDVLPPQPLGSNFLVLQAYSNNLVRNDVYQTQIPSSQPVSPTQYADGAKKGNPPLKPYNPVAYEYPDPPQQDGLGERRQWDDLTYNASLKSWDGNSVSQFYQNSNKVQLGNAFGSDKVYQQGKVGIDGKLFNLWAIGNTWDPPQQDGLGTRRQWNSLANSASLKSWNGKSVSQKWQNSDGRQLLNADGSDKVYKNKVGIDGELFNSWAIGNTWNPQQSNLPTSSINGKSAVENRFINNEKNVYQSVSPSASISPTDYVLSASIKGIKSPLKNQTPQPGVLPSQQFPQDTFVYTQKNIQNVSKDDVGSAKIGKPILQDFRKKLKLKDAQKTNAEQSGATPKSPDYETKNLEARVNIGGKNGFGPGNKEGKNLVSYSNGSGIGPVDKINAYPLYQATSGPSTGTKNDLVKFRIAVINNDNPKLKTFIHFRAFIDNFSDSYNATWNPTTYLGRGENFYTYNNYTRTISLGWTVVAQSKQELIPMYHKLNYLASSLTPYYTSKGYMAGNLVQLTVGGYLYETVGIINSLTYDIPEESPWEIGINDVGGNDDSVKELPHIIRVTNFSFTPIQDFIPSLQSNTYSGPNGRISGFGDQQYISLANGDGEGNIKTNYNPSDILAV